MSNAVRVLIERRPASLTPEALFLRIADEPCAFFLDSAIPAGGLGRYSILGARPFLIHRSRGRHLTRTWRSGHTERKTQDPWQALRDTLALVARHSIETPLPFVGGFVGYFAYDLGRTLESIPDLARDDLELPECWLACYGAVFVFDHLEQTWFLIAVNPDAPEHPRLTHQRFRWLKKKFQEVPERRPKPKSFQRGPIRSNFTREAYLRAVERIREYIAAGDIYQVNLSQRFHTRWQGWPPDLYQALRRLNPAPFAAYLDTGEAVVLSSSPERFLKLDARTRRVETRPIKGTRPRGKTSEEDEALAQELFHSPKDRAELLMIIDLERNDLGRVCEIGSVRVPSLFRLESYATVHHLVSTVVGRLAQGRDVVDLLQATFPGGSITGAPKIRAMQIIEELEPTRRYVYTGAIGYLSLSGDLDLNIAIRTLLLKGQDVYFQLGGGVVWDSDPVLEYEETLHKGEALFDLFQEA